MPIKFLKRYSRINLALVDQAMVSGVNFLTGLLIARFLGIEAFGVFTLVWMSVLFVNSIQMAMISAPMMTIGPKQSDEERPGYYGAVVLQQLIFSTATSLLLWLAVVLSDLINPQWQVAHLALPLAMSLFFFQNQDFLRRLFFTSARPLAALINDAVSYLGQIVLLIFFFLRTSPVTADVLWIIAVSSALAVIVGLFQLDKLVFSTSQLWLVLKSHWVLSKWLTVSAIMQWTSGNYFILTAGSLLGPIAVGAIRATQNIIGVVHILFQGLENIVPSAASRHFEKDSVWGLKQYLVKVSFWGGGATVVIALAVSVFPGVLLGLTYGEQYEDYGNVLRWYALCYIFMFFSLPLRAGLRVLAVSKPIFIAYGLMTIFSVLSAEVMVGNWGVHGAMAGILCTQLIMLSCLYLYLKVHFKKMEDVFLSEAEVSGIKNTIE